MNRKRVERKSKVVKIEEREVTQSNNDVEIAGTDVQLCESEDTWESVEKVLSVGWVRCETEAETTINFNTVWTSRASIWNSAPTALSFDFICR